MPATANHVSGIDAISSLTTLPLLRDPVDLYSVLGDQGPSLDHLPAFLHEATHHWCTGHRLGKAMAELAGRVVLGMHDLDGLADDAKGAHERVVALGDPLRRYEAAKELIRPLSEGMALFAEFDIVTGTRSRLVSRPYNWMQTVFLALTRDPRYSLRNVFEEHSDSDGVLNPEGERRLHFAGLHALLDSRLTSACIDRKARLLLNPFPARNGGYLPGYLAVKSLWWECGSRHQLMLDEPDLFLTFLHAYVFDDPVLAAALVDPAVSAATAITNFTRELTVRLQSFADVATVTALELLQTPPYEIDSERQMRAIGRPDGIGDAMDILNAVGDSFVAEATQTEERENLARALFAGRELLYLGSLAHPVAIAGGIAKLEFGAEAVQFPVQVSPSLQAPQNARMGDAVRLFAVPLPVGAAVVAVVCQLDEAIALYWIVAPEHARERFTPRILGGDLMLAGEQRTQSYARERVEQLENFHQEAMASLRGYLELVIDELYRPLALMHEPENRRDDVTEAMCELGVKGLGLSVRQARELARLSVACAIRPSRTSLARIYQAHGLDLDAALESLRNAQAQTGGVVQLHELQHPTQTFYIAVP